MIRVLWTGAAVAIVAAASAAFVAGIGLRPNATVPLVSAANAMDSGTTIYFQEPDGKPFYSLTPRKTSDGRDYRTVPARADVSFEEFDDAPADDKSAGVKGDRKIKYYRNPMGLPDTSSVPKKDSMGMDYIPVYEGDDTDDGSVKLSPGKI